MWGFCGLAAQVYRCIGYRQLKEEKLQNAVYTLLTAKSHVYKTAHYKK